MFLHHRFSCWSCLLTDSCAADGVGLLQHSRHTRSDVFMFSYPDPSELPTNQPTRHTIKTVPALIVIRNYAYESLHNWQDDWPRPFRRLCGNKNILNVSPLQVAANEPVFKISTWLVSHLQCYSFRCKPVLLVGPLSYTHATKPSSSLP